MGAGLLAFTNAKMQLGIELVAQTIYLEDKIKEADYVFTGEGGMDYQTKFGKAPYGVCKIAKNTRNLALLWQDILGMEQMFFMTKE